MTDVETEKEKKYTKVFLSLDLWQVSKSNLIEFPTEKYSNTKLTEKKDEKGKYFFVCILSRLKFLVQNLSSIVLNTTFVILLE